MKRKLLKSKNDIVLSIKYARLKEEVSDTEAKKAVLADKKLVIGSKDKALEKQKSFISEAKSNIKKIEDAYKPINYELVVNDKLSDKINSLSKYKNLELIKYNIAIDTVLDDEFDYKNTDDLLERISLSLFNDKYEIQNIKKILNKIEGIFYKTETLNTIDSAIGALKQVPLNKLGNAAQVAIRYFGKVKFAIGAIGVIGTGTVGAIAYFKRRKHARALSHLEPGELARVLIACALNITYAKKTFVNNETGYRAFLKTTIKDINLQRSNVLKDVFEKHYDVKQNQLKLELYYKFDNYFIELLKSKK